MMILAPLVMLAVQQSEAARTVNDAELGPAAEFTTERPATVCLRNLVVRPTKGQSVQLTYSGIHFGSLRLDLANGEHIEFTDGDNFRDQRKRGQRPVWRQERMGFYRVDDDDEGVRYQIEGRSIRTDYGEPPRVMIDGANLAGNRSDRKLFVSVSFEKPDDVVCDRRYEYGWGVIFGDEPLQANRNKAGDGEEN